MILVDAGPLLAIVDRADPNHRACVAAGKGLAAEPLLTTWPCLTEAMHLAHREGGFALQAKLWQVIESGRLLLHDPSDSEVLRMPELMAQYSDLPMDLADASIVAAGRSFRSA